MIPIQNLTRSSSRVDFEKLELGFWTRVKPRKIRYAETFSPAKSPDLYLQKIHLPWTGVVPLV